MIDWNRAEELREEVGAEDFDEVVEIFLEEVEEVLERMKSAPDPASLEADMHFLKGAALNLGFSDFSAFCQAGESAAAKGQSEGIALANLFTLYDGSKSAFMGRYGAG